jgi:hypothetical protein
MNHEATFIKRPVQVQAVQYTRRFAWPEWFHDRVAQGTVKVFGTGKFAVPNAECYCLIETLEGTHRCDENDWIIQGVKGELYPCKPDIFKLTYEESPKVGEPK